MSVPKWLPPDNIPVLLCRLPEEYKEEAQPLVVTTPEIVLFLLTLVMLTLQVLFLQRLVQHWTFIPKILKSGASISGLKSNVTLSV